MVLSAGQLNAQAIGPNAEALSKSREKAVNFLKSSQATDGFWTSEDALGVSGLVTYSLLISGVPATDPVMEKALTYLNKHIRPDGGIYAPKGTQKNYETSICMMALQAANKEGKYTDAIAKGAEFLRKLQWDESESIDGSDIKYGGAGYGRNGDRPDMSNTIFFMDALKSAGAKSDDPALQKALVFLSRCQNLETSHNTTKFSSLINDGGFYYTIAAGGSSPAGTAPNGGLRSYGSITYAGLKGMIYAGLTPDDQRVKTAVEWVTKYYTVEENPGMGQQGVLYYYQMFSKVLSTMDIDILKDGQGKSHDWRKELAEQLFKTQQENGAWLNKVERWYESNPDLGTAYVLISLKYCEPKAAKAR
ncbi:MAG: hypothetical protein JWP89_5598 [Schlesneria sp.]|nr:hypothetical protein [Schlesneria sp.]